MCDFPESRLRETNSGPYFRAQLGSRTLRRAIHRGSQLNAPHKSVRKRRLKTTGVVSGSEIGFSDGGLDRDRSSKTVY